MLRPPRRQQDADHGEGLVDAGVDERRVSTGREREGECCRDGERRGREQGSTRPDDAPAWCGRGDDPRRRHAARHPRPVPFVIDRA